jgi:hypothetical protein
MPSVAPSRRQIKKSLSTNFNPDWRYRRGRMSLRARQALHVPALLTEWRVRAPIFIIGAPRSGTHMLYLAMRKHGDLAHWRPSEAHEVWEADYHPALRGWESNVLDSSDVEARSARRIRRTFYLVTGPNKRLVEKTPRNVLRLPFVDALFPDARYVFLQRDGRETVNSLVNAWRSPRYRTYELPELHRIPGVDPKWWKFVLYPGWRGDTNGPLEVVCAKQWAISNEYALKGRADIGEDRMLTVRYEDLVEDPVSVIGGIMDFLGLAYEPVVRAGAESIKTHPVNTVTPPEAGKWRRENPKEIESILSIIEPMMKQLGYDSAR